MQQTQRPVSTDAWFEMKFMLLLLVVAGCIVAYLVYSQSSAAARPLPSVPTVAASLPAQQLPKHEDITEFGKPLKQLTIWQKPHTADATQQAFAIIPSTIEGFNANLAQTIKDCLIAARQHLPRTYIAYVVWLDSEIILLLEPTTVPLTTDQISAFERVFRALKVPIAEDRNNYRRFSAVQGRFKGAHGVAIPLRKPDAPKKPAA